MNTPVNQSASSVKVQSASDLGAFLGTRMKQIKSVIASNLTPEKMARIALNELRNSEFLTKIAVQNPESFVNAVVQASHLGLEIGGTLGQAYLVPYKGEIKMQTGYRGLISLARRSGEITSINAEIVYEKDEFDLVLGVDAKVTHKPRLDGPRGEPRLAYMVAKFKDGGHHFEWMSIADVYSIRDRSAAVQSAKKSGKQTPWDTDRDEMIRKTVIRRGWKYLPMSIEMQAAQVIDTAVEAGKQVTIDGDAVLVRDDPDAHEPEVVCYSDADFAKNLPTWTKLIADGKKTPDQIIAMANSKAPLTDEQKAMIKAAAVPKAGNEVTFEHVQAQLMKASDIDLLDAAADLIGEVADPEERKSLGALYNTRKEELSK